MINNTDIKNSSSDLSGYLDNVDNGFWLELVYSTGIKANECETIEEYTYKVKKEISKSMKNSYKNFINSIINHDELDYTISYFFIIGS